jgi:hypothetical protein
VATKSFRLRVRAAALIVGLSVGVLAAPALGRLAPAGAQVDADASLPKNTWMALSGDPLRPVLARARKFAACVRRHGISGLPDPKIIGGDVVLLLPGGLKRTSPRLKKAERACRRLLATQGGSLDTGGKPLLKTRP